MTDEEFRKRVLVYACPHCSVEAGASCKDKRGYKTAIHERRKDRLRQSIWAWERRKTAPCPTCGGKGVIKLV